VSCLMDYETHFFDPSQGRGAFRLVEVLGRDVVVGFAAGLLVWGIAVWVSSATRPLAET